MFHSEASSIKENMTYSKAQFWSESEPRSIKFLAYPNIYNFK